MKAVSRSLPGLMLAAALMTAAIPASAQDSITDAQIRDIVTRVARHQVHPLRDGNYAPVSSLEAARKARPAQGLNWEYPRGVALYAMARSADLTGDKAVAKFVVDHNQIAARYWRWLAGVSAQFGKPGQEFAQTTALSQFAALDRLDFCGAMTNAMLDGMIRDPKSVTAEEKAVLARCADWVIKKQARLPDGTWWRPERGKTVWPDDLFMGGVFLLHYALYTHDQKYIDDVARNIIQQAALEQDRDGLWYHGYFVGTKTHAPFKWARGNGWVTVALAETLSVMGTENPLRPQLLTIFRKQVVGLKPLQAPSGLWRQVLDKPALWEETSATAMFAYGIARGVHRGWLPASDMAIARHAFAGIAKNVTAEGAVEGTCAGTDIGATLDFYASRPRPHDDPHGRGPVLLAGTELLMSGK